ncbi:MAG: hypothetical protein H6661_09035 [Ardenticatenaceae bacterium]|nr:hypothetical protein [Ardenticatenaceae bacterium]
MPNKAAERPCKIELFVVSRRRHGIGSLLVVRSFLDLPDGYVWGNGRRRFLVTVKPPFVVEVNNVVPGVAHETHGGCKVAFWLLILILEAAKRSAGGVDGAR